MKIQNYKNYKYLRYSIIILGLLFFSQLSKALTINDWSIQQQPNNILRYDFSCTTDEESHVFLTYQHIENTDTITQHTNLSNFSTNHSITIIDLLPQTNYFFSIHAFNSSGQTTLTSTDLAFNTDTLPTFITPNLVVEIDTSEKFEGYVSAFRDINLPTVYNAIFDNQGRLVWYDPIGSNLTTISPGCGGGSWTSENNFLVASNCNSFLETSLFGDTLLELTNLDISFVFHHEAIRNRSNNIVALIAQAYEVDKSSIGGPANSLVVADGLAIFDDVGTLLWQWSAIDHLDPLHSEDFNDFWDETLGEGAIDWTHANGIFQTSDGHYLMSLARTNQILKIDANSGELIWILGDNGDFALEEGNDFAFQHHITQTSDSTYMLFDNGTFKRDFSRISEFWLDTTNMTAQVIWQFNFPPELSTGILGSATRLPNGNILTTNGTRGQVFEISESGDIVWQADGGSSIYRIAYLPYLYAPFSDINLQISQTTICQNAEPLTLQATPKNGYFQGTAVQNGQFDPQQAGIGTHAITYTYGWETVSQEIAVVAAQEVPIISQNNDTLTIENIDASLNYQWFLNDEPIDGAIQPTFIAQQSGLYSLEATNDRGCITTSTQIDVVVTGQPHITNNLFNLTIFPNPFQEQTNLQYHLSQPTHVEISLFDINGRKITTVLNVQQYPNKYNILINNNKLLKSIYIVRISLGDKVYYKKIIQQ